MGGPQKYSHLFDDEEDEAPPAKAKEPTGGQDIEQALSNAKAVGNGLFQEGRYDDALAAYKKGLDTFEGSAGRFPKNLDPEVKKLAIALYCNSAQTQLKCSGTRGAAATRSRMLAERALALDSQNVKALFRRGCAYSFAEDWPAAIQDFTLVLELEPGSDAARRELEKAQEQRHGPGPVPRRSGLLSSRQDPLESMIADAEDDKAKGARLFKDKRYTEAVEVWRHAISNLGTAIQECPAGEFTPQAQRLLVALCNNSAQALLQCPEVEGATTKLAYDYANQALEIEPSNIKALFRRGCSYVNSEKWFLARKDFEHVLELEPGNPAAQEELEKMKANGVMEPEEAEGSKPDLSNPEVAVKMAQREVERFRREILAHADGQSDVPKWCQRFNKMQVQAAAWAQHQLADTDGLQDLITLRGPVFGAMDDKQREDFIAACEFLSEMRAQHGPEIDELLRKS